MAAVTLPIMSFIKSGVLASNDFGWRASLFFLFPGLLLGSELIVAWGLVGKGRELSADVAARSSRTPKLLRSVTALALLLGMFTSIFQALLLRFNIPVFEWGLRQSHSEIAGRLPHHAYLAMKGYADLDVVIAPDAIVQFNPAYENKFWMYPDLLSINRQMAIITDKGVCGAELGGDPTGCRAMAGVIDSLYIGATGEHAQATCRELGIQYLVSNIYDSVWNRADSWVWTLRPVVENPEFRVLQCAP
jgi:hypothetical protein